MASMSVGKINSDYSASSGYLIPLAVMAKELLGAQVNYSGDTVTLLLRPLPSDNIAVCICNSDPL